MTAPDRPAVTVICPTYNRSRAILDTIASVRRQSVDDWEMLVVSDGSTDDTDDHVRQAAAADPRVRLVRTSRHGHPAEPRNLGLAAARGPIVAYLDHDDRWQPDHLRVVVDEIDCGAAIVATGAERRNAAGELLGTSAAADLLWHPEVQLLSPMFEPSRVAHRRGLVERVGGWRPGVGLEDWDLWLRLADFGVYFRTVLDRTVTLVEDRRSRRHSTARRHVLPLMDCGDARRARAALDGLRDPRNHPQLRGACLVDTQNWFRRLAADPAFVHPRGWTGDPMLEMDRCVRTSWFWPADDLVVTARSGRFVVGLMLWCGTAEHARRIGELTPRVQPEQLALVGRICRAAGASGVAGS